jgi:hypothetical protein
MIIKKLLKATTKILLMSLSGIIPQLLQNPSYSLRWDISVRVGIGKSEIKYIATIDVGNVSRAIAVGYSVVN